MTDDGSNEGWKFEGDVDPFVPEEISNNTPLREPEAPEFRIEDQVLFTPDKNERHKEELERLLLQMKKLREDAQSLGTVDESTERPHFEVYPNESTKIYMDSKRFVPHNRLIPYANEEDERRYVHMSYMNADRYWARDSGRQGSINDHTIVMEMMLDIEYLKKIRDWEQNNERSTDAETEFTINERGTGDNRSVQLTKVIYLDEDVALDIPGGKRGSRFIKKVPVYERDIEYLGSAIAEIQFNLDKRKPISNLEDLANEPQ